MSEAGVGRRWGVEDALKSLCAFRLTLNIPVSKTTQFW
jgi:hypothetical protein